MSVIKYLADANWVEFLRSVIGKQLLLDLITYVNRIKPRTRKGAWLQGGLMENSHAAPV